MYDGSQLERTLYQLYAISFFLSPAFLPYLCRTMFQFQFARPRDIEPRLSLRFWFILIILFNINSIWVHATEGPVQGRSVVLDFVGQGALCVLTSLVAAEIVLLRRSLTPNKTTSTMHRLYHHHP